MRLYTTYREFGINCAKYIIYMLPVNGFYVHNIMYNQSILHWKSFSIIHAGFLETDILPSASVAITCNSPGSGGLRGWSHSPGTAMVTDLLDTSPSKYTVSGNTLTIMNINRADEGVYSCIYSNGVTLEHCIYVYGEAFFLISPKLFRLHDNIFLMSDQDLMC